MRYLVKTFRDVGLEARWVKDGKGRPYIVVRDPKSELEHQRRTWWIVDKGMWRRMHDFGIKEGFDNSTIWGDVLSI